MPHPDIFFWMQSQCKTVIRTPESRLNFKYKSFPTFAPFTLIEDIADNATQHARTPMLQALFIFWGNVLVVKCVSEQMSVRAHVFLGKCLSEQISFWANVFLGKCLLVNCLSGQMSFWANVIWANVLLGKYLSGQMSFWANVFWANIFLGKCLSGQKSSGQMSFWANVFLVKRLLGKCLLGKCFSRQMSQGKCLWANVVWTNVVSPLGPLYLI
jgi:hypothetical protein